MLTAIYCPRRATQLGAIFVLAALALTIGCAPLTGRLTGKVLLHGQPVPNTELELIPIDDASRNFRGIGLDDGTYQVDYGTGQGLPIGKYRARITFYVQANGQPIPPGETGAALKISGQARPRTYLLEFAVEQGLRTLDLNLDTAKPEKVGV
ncbi:MAG TPA: hypothetical protein VL096_05180 [Pirellulaceae bacterium]|nr:hypothetical protein [Pirellulaceae bacterium]